MGGWVRVAEDKPLDPLLLVLLWPIFGIWGPDFGISHWLRVREPPKGATNTNKNLGYLPWTLGPHALESGVSGVGALEGRINREESVV